VTAATTADVIAVSWRWNGSSSSVLTCVRSIKIIYQPVGDKNNSFDVAKSSTRFTLRGQQCNMGCAITIRSVDVNGIATDKECTTSGWTQICRAYSTKCTNNHLLLLHTCLKSSRLANWPRL